MASVLDQYEKRMGIAPAKKPEEKPVAQPKPDTGVFGRVKQALGMQPKQEITPAAVAPKKASVLDQFDQRLGFEPPLTPEEDKKASMAAFTDTTPEPVRQSGADLRKLIVATGGASAPRVLGPEQKKDPIVKRVKDAYNAYADQLGRLSENVALGATGTVESMLGFAQWAGVESAKDPADKLQAWIDEGVKKQGDLTFADKLAQGFGSSAVFFVPGLGVQGAAATLASVSPRLAILFGGSASAALEAMSEAGNVYREVQARKGQDQGVLDADAHEAALKTFYANLFLVGLTNRFGVFNPDAAGFVRRMVFAAPIEGIQEAAQQLISNATLEREDLYEGTGESFLIGSIVGGLMSAGVETVAQNTAQNILPVPGQKTPETAPGEAEVKAPIEEAVAPESTQEPGKPTENTPTIEAPPAPPTNPSVDEQAQVDWATNFEERVAGLHQELFELNQQIEDGATPEITARAAAIEAELVQIENDFVAKWEKAAAAENLEVDEPAAPVTQEIDVPVQEVKANVIDKKEVLIKGIDDILGRFEGDTFAQDLLRNVRANVEGNGISVGEFVERLLKVQKAMDGNRFAREGIDELIAAAQASQRAALSAPAIDAASKKGSPTLRVYVYGKKGSHPHPSAFHEVSGAIVDLGIPGMEFFVHHPVTAEKGKAIENKKRWAVSEVSSGALISEESTRAKAIESAKEKVREAGPEKIRELVERYKAHTKANIGETAQAEKAPDEVLTLKTEDLEKQIEVLQEKLVKEGRPKEFAAKEAKEKVSGFVQLETGEELRPDQVLTKSNVRDLLSSMDSATLDFTVQLKGEIPFLTLQTEKSRMSIRAGALGLIEKNLKEGQTVRMSAEELKKKGRSFRAHGASGGALAFMPKNLDGGTGTPAGNKEVDKIVKRSEIARELSQKLGVPVRSGHIAQRRAAGIFKPAQHVIRLKSKLGNSRIPVLVHEAGHYIDYTLLGDATMQGKNWTATKLVSSKIPMKELDGLVSEYGGTPGSYPKKKEAFAEFIRFWVTEPAKAKALAPKFTEIWEQEILPDFPEVRDALETTRADWERWQAMPAVAKVVSQISFGERSKSVDEMKDAVVQTWHDLRTQWIDDLHPIQRFVDLAKDKKITLNIEEDPYILARLSRGWVGKASTFLEKGTFDVRFWKEEEGRAVPIFTGKGFSEIMAPVAKKGATEDLSAYLVAKRAIELHGRGIQPGISLETAQQALAELEAKHPEFAGTAQELIEYQDAVLDYVRQSGLISEQTRIQMRELNKSYTPFHRVMEEAERKGFGGKTLADLRSPVKRIKGSDRDIVNPLESIVKNTYALINASERNRVGMAMVNLSRKHPELGQLFEKVPTEQTKVASVSVSEILEQAGLPSVSEEEGDRIVNIFRPSFFKGDNILTVMIGGKPQSYYVEKDIYRAMQGMDVEDIGFVWKLMSYPARWLRAGATLTPEFMVRNPARDMMSAYVYSEYGFMPPIDLPRGLYGAIARDQDYWLWRMGGGEQAMLVSMDRTTLKKTYEELANAHNLASMTTLKKGLRGLYNPMETLRIFSEFSEKMTRVGAAKKALDRNANPLEAAFSAREVTLDFARAGNRGRAMNMIVAFFNAGIQGTSKMVRSFNENPRRFMTRSLLGITLPSVLLTLWNMEEPDWEEIPQWQKNLFWMIKIGDTPQPQIPGVLVESTSKGVWVRFPKPFELGILFGSVPERVIESIKYRDPGVFPELVKAIRDGATPSVLPTSVLPIVENVTNYNFFLDRNIVPDSQESLPAFAQYTAYTSETAKHIGKWLNYSPAKIDNLIQGYFAGLGRYATSIIDWTEQKIRGEEAPAEPPAPTLSDIPIIKAFVVREPIGSASESVARFYVKAEQAEASKNYHKDLIDRGQYQEAEAWMAEHGGEIALAKYYTQVRQTLATMRRLQNMARDSKTLTPQEKRERIDMLGRQMTDIAYKATHMTLKDEE